MATHLPAGPFSARPALPVTGRKASRECSTPGSDDGSVPALNPIDPTIANPDSKVFAANVDRVVQHGSQPDGPNPALMMPSFGDDELLTQQQIADLIVYVMSLNGVQ